jgi:hypothetical protein
VLLLLLLLPLLVICEVGFGGLAAAITDTAVHPPTRRPRPWPPPREVLLLLLLLPLLVICEVGFGGLAAVINHTAVHPPTRHMRGPVAATSS